MPVMAPAFRKLTLTVHITSSVGWLGAVASFLILSIAGMTTVATIVLLLKTQLIGYMADVAAKTTLLGAALHEPRSELVVHSGGGLVVLLATVIVSVYKPWGRTRYGRRKLFEQRAGPDVLEGTLTSPSSTLLDSNHELTGGLHSFPLKFLMIVLGLIAAVFGALHLAGGGFGDCAEHWHGVCRLDSP